MGFRGVGPSVRRLKLQVKVWKAFLKISRSFANLFETLNQLLNPQPYIGPQTSGGGDGVDLLLWCWASTNLSKASFNGIQHWETLAGPQGFFWYTSRFGGLGFRVSSPRNKSSQSPQAALKPPNTLKPESLDPRLKPKWTYSEPQKVGTWV